MKLCTLSTFKIVKVLFSSLNLAVCSFLCITHTGNEILPLVAFKWRDLSPTANSELANLFSEDVSIVFGNSSQVPHTLTHTRTHTSSFPLCPPICEFRWTEVSRGFPLAELHTKRRANWPAGAQPVVEDRALAERRVKWHVIGQIGR